jgi:hypothetical protein
MGETPRHPIKPSPYTPMNTTEVRPSTTPAEDRAIVHAQALLFLIDLPSGHPARARIEAVVDRTRPLILAEEAHAEADLDHSFLAFVFFITGAALFMTGGALREFSLVATIILFLAGCVFTHLAYEKGGY